MECFLTGMFSSPELQHLEVACNNILRKIWSLLQRCHTSILHLVASIQSIYNSTIIRSNRLVVAAINSSSRILADVFCESSSLTYTSCGYNCLYGPKHTKSYNEAESLCASFIRDVRMSPSLNTALLGEIKPYVYCLVCNLILPILIDIVLDHCTYCGAL